MKLWVVTKGIKMDINVLLSCMSDFFSLVLSGSSVFNLKEQPAIIKGGK